VKNEELRFQIWSIALSCHSREGGNPVTEVRERDLIGIRGGVAWEILVARESEEWFGNLGEVLREEIDAAGTHVLQRYRVKAGGELHPGSAEVADYGTEARDLLDLVRVELDE
jgi:hypothetical protein